MYKRRHSRNKIARWVSTCLQIALCMATKYASVRPMASSADPCATSSDAPCVHPRLLLETSTKDRYLTGHYVCEGCGLHFDRPPIKQDPPLEQDPPSRPST